tara:strand:- start:872 stop:1042 length:171 start_codon:yes stop_codon:yes gene_type:complete
MLDKIKKAFTKKKPAVKKVISNMDDLDNSVGINQEVKSQSKSELKSETKSSLTFGK